MSLRKNSSDLIKILSDEPEKLKKINLLNDEEKIYNYIKDEIISDYTKEDFNEFKYIISKLDSVYSNNSMEVLDKDSLNNVSGGSLKDFEDICTSFLSGFNNPTIKKGCDKIDSITPKIIKMAKSLIEKEEKK